MTELLLVLVAGLMVIAAATVVGPRLGSASPLVLVAVGIADSLLPMFDTCDSSRRRAFVQLTARGNSVSYAVEVLASVSQ